MVQINTSYITLTGKRLITRPLRKIIERFYEDPTNAEKFKQWIKQNQPKGE